MLPTTQAESTDNAIAQWMARLAKPGERGSTMLAIAWALRSTVTWRNGAGGRVDAEFHAAPLRILGLCLPATALPFELTDSTVASTKYRRDGGGRVETGFAGCHRLHSAAVGAVPVRGGKRGAQRRGGGKCEGKGGGRIKAIHLRSPCFGVAAFPQLGASWLPLPEPALSHPFSYGSGNYPDAVRMRQALLLLSILLLPPLTLGVPGAAASDRRDHERARAALADGQIRPLSDLLAEVERRYVGRVIETELEREDGRWVYEFKLLPPSGRVARLYLDATTGTILRSRGPIEERR